MAMIFDEALRAGASAAPPREAVYSRTGVAATANPLVSMAALEVIRAGGNAVDAAIAGGALLMVVEPRNGHPGGDAFFLIDPGDGSDAVAINGSGAAAAKATLEFYRSRGEIPAEGLLSTTVPGLISAWIEAHARFGTRPLAELLAPAIAAAREGVTVSPRFHNLLSNDAPTYRRYPSSAKVFVPGGEVPRTGELFRQASLARTFERLIADGLEDFYTGGLAGELIAFSSANGGLFEPEDFAAQKADVRAPVRTSYRGYEILEQPPVSQGIVLLLALKILERFDLAAHAPDSAQRIHLLAEAYDFAFDERLRRLGDPRFVAFDEDAFLSDELAARLAAQIDPKRTRNASVRASAHADTTSAAFAAGPMTVVYIHSLYSGAGIVMGETGILMNSRLRNFSLDPGSPNVLAPGKRPIHTLNTWMIRQNGKTLFAGGTPGAHWQIQTNMQIITNLIDYKMDAVAAQSAPRFVLGDQHDDPDRTIKVESRIGEHAVEGLRARGHRVEILGPWEAGGAVQLVGRDPASDAFLGATEVRRSPCTVLGA